MEYKNLTNGDIVRIDEIEDGKQKEEFLLYVIDVYYDNDDEMCDTGSYRIYGRLVEETPNEKVNMIHVDKYHIKPMYVCKLRESGNYDGLTYQIKEICTTLDKDLADVVSYLITECQPIDIDINEMDKADIVNMVDLIRRNKEYQDRIKTNEETINSIANKYINDNLKRFDIDYD